MEGSVQTSPIHSFVFSGVLPKDGIVGLPTITPIAPGLCNNKSKIGPAGSDYARVRLYQDSNVGCET